MRGSILPEPAFCDADFDIALNRPAGGYGSPPSRGRHREWRAFIFPLLSPEAAKVSKPVPDHADRKSDEQDHAEQRWDGDEKRRAAEVLVVRGIGDGAGGDQRKGDDSGDGFHGAENAFELKALRHH